LISEPFGPFLFSFFPLGAGWGGERGLFLPPFSSFFVMGASPPVSGISVSSFPPTSVPATAFVSPFSPPFSVWLLQLIMMVASANYEVGPTSSLGDKTGAQRDVTCSVFQVFSSSGSSCPFPPLVAGALEVDPLVLFI
jgi:hypothetical protein